MMIQQFAGNTLLLPHDTRPLTCGSQYCILYNMDVPSVCFVTFVISDLSLVGRLSLFGLLFLCLVLYFNFIIFCSVPAAPAAAVCLSVKEWQWWWRCEETIIQFRRQTLKQRLKNNDTRLKRWWSIHSRVVVRTKSALPPPCRRRSLLVFPGWKILPQRNSTTGWTNGWSSRCCSCCSCSLLRLLLLQVNVKFIYCRDVIKGNNTWHRSLADRAKPENEWIYEMSEWTVQFAISLKLNVVGHHLT